MVMTMIPRSSCARALPIGLFGLLLGGLAGACSGPAFTCADDSACEGAGPGARCEADGWCSFEDPGCDGGRRYAELAGDDLGGACVGGAAATGGSESGSQTTSGPSTLDSSGPADPSTSDGEDTEPPPQEPWWDCDWQARRELVVQVPPIGETLVDVPVLLVLDASRIEPWIMAPDGRDLRVLADDHATVLAHEIEQWSPEGLSWVWVRVPQLHEGDNHLLLYYGNPSAPALDPAPTWSGYAAVWHMSFELADVTGHATPAAVVAQTTTGQVAQAQRFGAHTDGVSTLPSPELDGLFTNGGTITAMIRASSWGGNAAGFVVRRAETSNGDGGWVLGLDGSRAALRFGRGFDIDRSTLTTPDGSIALHTWHHVAVVYDDDPEAAPALYVDGVPQRLEWQGNPIGAPTPDELVPEIHIASSFSSAASWFHGIVDELRLIKQPRSPGWIAVQAASLRDALVRYGPPRSASCNDG